MMGIVEEWFAVNRADARSMNGVTLFLVTGTSPRPLHGSLTGQGKQPVRFANPTEALRGVSSHNHSFPELQGRLTGQDARFRWGYQSGGTRPLHPSF